MCIILSYIYIYIYIQTRLTLLRRPPSLGDHEPEAEYDIILCYIILHYMLSYYYIAILVVLVIYYVMLCVDMFIIVCDHEPEAVGGGRGPERG